MEPAAYQHMTSLMRGLPAQVPVDEEQASQDREVNLAEEQRQLNTNWTVYNMDVMRGNLDREEDVNDPRSHVGWTSNPAAQTSPDMPWMSTNSQQPYVGAEKDNGATPRPTHQSAATPIYPHPNLSLPHPSLSLDFRMSVNLNPKITVGPTPFGHRNWISFEGGSWSGTWGTGIVLPGGQDSQLIIPDGSTSMETNYLLQTLDTPPAHISVKTRGWRTGPPEVLSQLADPKLGDQVDPNSYKFRLFIELETGDERYKDKVNCGMWVGSGMRKASEVIYDAYRLS